MLADFTKTEAAVKKQDGVIVVFHENFGGQMRIASFGKALHIAVENPSDTDASARAGDYDAINIQKSFVAITEPPEVTAIVNGVITQGDQEACKPSTSATRK